MFYQDLDAQNKIDAIEDDNELSSSSDSDEDFQGQSSLDEKEQGITKKVQKITRSTVDTPVDEASTSHASPSKTTSINHGPRLPSAIDNGIHQEQKISEPKKNHEFQIKRGRGRPPKQLSLQNFSLGAYRSTIPSSTTSSLQGSSLKRKRGRPLGSKNKIRDDVAPLAASSKGSKEILSSKTGNEVISDGSHLLVENSASDAIWRIPESSRHLLDKVCITDVTANSCTITIRESSCQDGFFTSSEVIGNNT